MPAAKQFLRYWLPVLAWMALIFTGSGDANSGQRTSRIIGPILRWLFPALSTEAVEMGIVLVRKCAHVVEYAVLAALVWRALHRPVRGERRPWSRGHAWGAFFVACAYAVSDEFHQTWVATRQGSPWDVLVDAVGAGAGLWVLWRWRRRRAPGTGLPDEIAGNPDSGKAAAAPQEPPSGK